MDWQLSVMGPAITPVFWGLIRTPPEKRDLAAIEAGKEKTIDADEDAGRAARQDARSSPATTFSYGDIPVGIMMLPLHAARAGAAADAEPRPLVRRDLQAQGVPGSRRQHSAD